MAAGLDVSVAKIIALCQSNTLDSNRVIKSSNPHTLILDKHLRLGVFLLPKPPQTINLHLVQEKGIYNN